MTQLIHQDLTYVIRGVLFDIHNHLGPMLPEEIYQKAVAIGLQNKGIACQTEKAFEVYYRNQQVGLYYVDVWIEEGKVILELKVTPKILPLHQAQAIAYLQVTDADLALVVNFGVSRLEDERLPNFVRDKEAVFAWQAQPVEIAIPYPGLSNRLLEACHRVHFELGPGFLHQVYRRATMLELQMQGIPYEYIKKISITYQGQHIALQDARLIAVADKILLATVAVKRVDESMKLKLKARLKQLGFQLALLANFHHTTLETVLLPV